MSIKRVVLVVGLLGGLSSELNAIKPEHEERVSQIIREIDILGHCVEKDISDIELKEQAGIIDEIDCIILRDSYIANLKKMIILMQELLNYLESQDEAKRIEVEKYLRDFKKILKNLNN